MNEQTDKTQANKNEQAGGQTPPFDLFLVLTLSLGTLLGCLNQTIFNVAMPALMEYFHTDVTMIQWISSGYLLAAGVITPAAGFLGDHFGYKRIYGLAALLVLFLSVVGMFSWRIEALIVVRILFGLSAGLLIPLSMAMLYQNIPQVHQPRAAGIWGTANIVGAALPSCLTGVVISFASWQALFLIMAPLAVLLVFCTRRFLPDDRQQQHTSLDGLGLVLTAMGSFTLLFAFSNLAKWGFSVRFFVAAAIGLVLLAIYIFKSWRNDEAMLNLAVLRYPRYVAALTADVMNIVALNMIAFVMPLFLQNGLGLSALVTGALMLPGSIVTILTMPLATRVLSSRGEKTLAVTGIFFLLVGSAPFLHMTPAIPVFVVVLSMITRSFGMAFNNLLTTNTSMAAVPPHLSGHASSLTNWLRQMTAALVTSIASNIISLRLTAANAQTTEAVSEAYVSSTSLLTTVSCLLFVAIIPIAFKFFRSKAQMQADQQQ